MKNPNLKIEFIESVTAVPYFSCMLCPDTYVSVGWIMKQFRSVKPSFSGQVNDFKAHRQTYRKFCGAFPHSFYSKVKNMNFRERRGMVRRKRST